MCFYAIIFIYNIVNNHLASTKKIRRTNSKISTNSDELLKNMLGKSSTKTNLQLLLSNKDV